MKCAMLTQLGKIEILEQPRPVPAEDEVLIAVEMAALCGSDYSIYKGKIEASLPLIPGHEAVGRIAMLGKNVTDLALGQRVVIQPNFSCQTCTLCRSGLANVCPEKIRLGIDVNGVFAQFTKIPARYVWPVPEDLENEVAIFAEPIAVAYHALHKCLPEKNHRVLVFGAGVIGLITTQLVALQGNDVFALDLVSQRLDIAKEIGARQVFQDMEALVRQGPFDIVFETSGSAAALGHAIELAAPGGSIILAGLPAAPHPILTTRIVRKELKIFGSIIYTDEFPAVLKFLQTGAFKTQPLISGIHNLETLPECLEGFCQPDRVKTLIRLNTED